MIGLRLVLLGVVPMLVAAVLIAIGASVAARRAESRITAAESILAVDTIAGSNVDQAQALATGLDQFVMERFNDAIDWSRDEVVLEAVSADYEQTEAIAEWPLSTMKRKLDATDQLDISGRSASYLEAKTGDSALYLGALFTDSNGYAVGAVGDSTDFVHRDQDWWQTAWRNGAHIGLVVTSDQADPAYLIAIRIDDPLSRQPVGVFKTTIDPSAIQALTNSSAQARPSVEISVVDTAGQLVARSAPSLGATNPSATDGTATGNGGEEDDAVTLTVASGQRSGALVHDDFVSGFATTSSRYTIERLGVDVAGLDLATVVVQPSSAAMASLESLDTIGPDLQSQAISWTLALIALAGAAAGAAYLVNRSLSRQIAEPIGLLRNEAHRLADSELPELISLLRSTDGTGELPAVDLIRVDGSGEVAELAVAFNRLRATTVELATNQAIDHSKDLADVLVNLGRRNQQLINRQLRFIDELELSESDPEVLRNLFTLDQMATRMRRNAENLLVLAGERVSRGAKRPQRIDDVLRAATSEVEDFARVEITTVERTLIRPVVVSDLTHLLAELIENATRFSPQEAMVEVVGCRDNNGGYTISVLDLGPGMSRQALNKANRRINEPSYSGDDLASRLGLFVVGRLAARHLIDVRLVESARTGTTAKIMLPPGCLTPAPRPSGEVIGSRVTPESETSAPTSGLWPPPVRRPTTDQLPALATGETPVEGVEEPEGDQAESAMAALEAPSDTEEASEGTPDHSSLVDLVATMAGTVDEVTAGEKDALVEVEAETGSDADPETEARPEDEVAVLDVEAEVEAAVEAGVATVDVEQQSTTWVPDIVRGPAATDETDGVPIPPFRARRSKRTPETELEPVPIYSSDSRTDQPPGDLALIGSGQDEDTQGEARAEKVRDRLSRYTQGVAAAKAMSIKVALNRNEKPEQEGELPFNPRLAKSGVGTDNEVEEE